MNWLKNAWYVAGFLHELEGQDWVARRILDVPLLLMRGSDGRLAALEDTCPHRLLPLSMGTRIGNEVQCGYHGMRFDLAGRCVEAPGQRDIPAAARLQTRPLQARHGLLWIWMGQAAAADPGLIPDMHWHDDAGWAPSSGYHRVEADYRLVMDNLLDLGHESWVHKATIGNGEEHAIPNYPVRVEVENDGVVRAERVMCNIAPPPFFRMVLEHGGPIHRWQVAVSQVPSMCMTDAGVFPVEASPEQAFRSVVLHLLTPETEGTTHYFWANCRNYRLDDAALTVSIQQAIAHTFDEDAVVLKVQQRQIESLGGRVPRVALRVDEAPMRARRLLDALVQREAQDPTHAYQPVPMADDRAPAAALFDHPVSPEVSP